MKIFELFDRPLPYELDTAGSDELLGTFEINGRPYEVEFDAGGGVLDINFYDEYGEQAATGAGDPIPVFSTVVAMARDAYKRSGSHGITFSASGEEPSRVRLYKRMASQIAKELGLDFKTAKYGSDTRYVLTKPQ